MYFKLRELSLTLSRRHVCCSESWVYCLKWHKSGTLLKEGRPVSKTETIVDYAFLFKTDSQGIALSWDKKCFKKQTSQCIFKFFASNASDVLACHAVCFFCFPFHVSFFIRLNILPFEIMFPHEMLIRMRKFGCRVLV